MFISLIGEQLQKLRNTHKNTL